MRLFEKIKRNISGSIVPMTVLLIGAMVPLCGLAVDISYYGIVKSSLEKAAEAASVAGAQEYFRSMADAGRAVNHAVRVFKMNISDDTMTGSYYGSTGVGSPAMLTFSRTFTSSDGINALFRGAPVTITVMTDLDRGKVSVTSDIDAMPFFSSFLGNSSMIDVAKDSELPPYDVTLVVDLSSTMRFATVMTYIGMAHKQIVGMSGNGPLFDDVILYQAQRRLYNNGDMITANGFVITINGTTDIVSNVPGYDIPTSAQYSDARQIYINDPERGFIVNNTINASMLVRTTLTGQRISELATSGLSAEERQVEQSYLDNRSAAASTIQTYFNRFAPYIEPHASVVYGVRSFIDTVKIYGTAGLKLALVTFELTSSNSDVTTNWQCSELKGNNIDKRMARTAPYVMLVNPVDFDSIVQKLTIMATSGNGTTGSPIVTYSYPNAPSGNGTSINSGLDAAKRTFDSSDRPNSEKILILFTDGAPNAHTFDALGNKVKSLVDAGIKVYSVVLTLTVTQNTIDSFKYQMETRAMAEPVIFIYEPSKIKTAFMQIADDLGLRLTN